MTSAGGTPSGGRPPVVLALVLLLSACAATSGGVQGSATPPGDRFTATVVRVVDGDTFVARRTGSSRTVKVRIIGIDTPETVKDNTPVRCGGPAASARTAQLLPKGAQIQAAYERGGATDRFGRDLWDVWLPDGGFLAATLVSTGIARAYRVRPQTVYADLLARLERQARAAKLGVWGPPCNGHSFGQ